MKRIILLTFDPNADVYYPLVELLGKEDVSEVLIPVITRGIFTETAINAVKEQGIDFKIFLDVETTIDGIEEEAEQIIICTNPIKELLNLITPDDILAMLANGGLVFVIAVLLRNGRARTQLEKSNEGQCNIVRNSHGDSFRKMTLEC